jgi:hypothetical protein
MQQSFVGHSRELEATAMPAYRLFRTDGSGQIRSSEVVQAETDALALRAARQMLDGRSGELWLESKIVARFAMTDFTNRGSPPVPPSQWS